MDAKKEKIGIVLCGGGAMGAFEIGAWRFLKEINFHYDIVTGTSIGALNGALMVLDDYQKALEIWERIDVDQVMVDGVDVNEHFFRGFFSLKKYSRIHRFIKNYAKNHGANIAPFKELVKKSIDPKKIQSSPIDFGIVTCTYFPTREVDINMKKIPEEDVVPFLHASSACYPIFPIEKIKGKKYIDGGFKNNLPIDFAIELGATKIIAILLDTFPTPQMSELQDLPFVKKISPSHTIGHMMDFTQTSIRDNMVLGYNDAAKAFGKYLGFAYTFYKDNLEIYQDIADEFFHLLILKSTRHYKRIDQILAWKDEKHLSQLDYFIRAIEIMAEFSNIDYLKVYHFKELIKLCYEAIDEYAKDEKVMRQFYKIEKGIFNKFEENEKAFVYYIKVSLKRKFSIEFLWEYVDDYPELAIILALCQIIYRHIDELDLIKR